MLLAFDAEVDTSFTAEDGDLFDKEAAEETKEGEVLSVGSEDSTDKFADRLPKLIWGTNKIIRYTGVNGEPLMKCTFCDKEWKKWNHTKAMGHAIGGCGDIQQCKKVPPRWIKVFRRINSAQKNKKAVKKAAAIKHEHLVDEKEDRIARAIAKQARELSKYSAKRKSPPEQIEVLSSEEEEDVLAVSQDSSISIMTKSSSTPRSYDLFIKSEKERSSKKPKNSFKFQTSITSSRTHTTENENQLNQSIAHFLAANSLPFSLVEDTLLKRVITRARNVGSSYKMPSRSDVGGKYLTATYNSYREVAIEQLLTDAETFGVMMLGDGATIKDCPQMNVLASSENNHSCCLDVIDCSNWVSQGNKKDAWYVAKCFLPIMREIDPKKELIDLVAFDGASNMQKAAKLIGEHFPRVSVIAGLEHTVSLVFGRFMNTEVIKVMCLFCKEWCICVLFVG